MHVSGTATEKRSRSRLRGVSVSCVSCVAVGVALLTVIVDARPSWAQATSSRGDDDESALLVDEAREHIADKDYAAAGRALDRALVLNPRRIEAYVLRASVYAARKDYGAGIAVMRRAARLAPENPDVLTTLGSQLILAGQVAEGVPLLEQVVARRPRRYDAHILLGYHYAEVGEHRKAIRSFESYLATRPGRLAGEDATHRLALADAYLRAGEPGKARTLFRAVLDKAPGNPTARLGLAWATAAMDCSQALPLLVELEDQLARYPDVIVVRGKCELAMGMTAEATAQARRYLQRKPRSAAGHALLGEALAARGDHAGAREALSRARSLEPGNRRLAVRLARVERLAGNPAAAVTVLEALGPRQGDAIADAEWSIELAEALLAADRAGDAVKRLRPVVEAWAVKSGSRSGSQAGSQTGRKTADDGAAREVLGAALYASGDAAGAVPYLEQALARNPDSARARALLASALATVAGAQIASKELAAADASLTRAAEVEPGPRIWRNQGVVRLLLGRPEAAIEPLDSAGRAGDAIAQQLHARALGQVGRVDEARQRFASAMAARRDAAGRAEVVLELASMELALGQAERAVAALEEVEASASKTPHAAEIAQALVSARHAAGVEALKQGAFPRALRLLEAAERDAKGREQIAIRCHVALAATAGGERAMALARLRELDRANAECPFPEPADRLAVPALIALNRGMQGGRPNKTIARLEGLQRRATGPARELITAAIRMMTIDVAVDAYERGNTSRAQKYLSRAARIEGTPSNETRHNLIVLDLDRKDTDQIRAALEALADEVPEALINIGVLYDRDGQPLEALEYYERAQARGVRFAPLAEWIAAKRRVFAGRRRGER